MARTALAVQQIGRAGITPAYTPANADGHAVRNVGAGEFIHVKTGATGCTVTAITPGSVNGLAIADSPVVIGADSERMIGPFPPSLFNQDGGDVHIDFSQVATVTCAAFRPQ